MSVLVASVVSGCSGDGSLSFKAPPPAYDRVAARYFHHRVGHSRGQLIISEPTALAVFDDDNVAVRPQPGETAALNDA